MQLNNNLQQLFFTKLAMGDAGEGAAVDVIKAMTKRREDAYRHYLNDRLAESAYLAGPEFSCAGIMVMFNLTALPLFGSRGIDDLEHVKL
jgi:glutathione S-transferase